MRGLKRLLVLAIVGAGVLGTSGIAATAGVLEAPSGPVILTVSGAIENMNAESSANFDRTMLEKLGTRVVTTATPWTEGEVPHSPHKSVRLPL